MRLLNNKMSRDKFPLNIAMCLRQINTLSCSSAQCCSRGHITLIRASNGSLWARTVLLYDLLCMMLLAVFSPKTPLSLNTSWRPDLHMCWPITHIKFNAMWNLPSLMTRLLHAAPLPYCNSFALLYSCWSSVRTSSEINQSVINMSEAVKCRRYDAEYLAHNFRNLLTDLNRNNVFTVLRDFDLDLKLTYT